MVIMVILRDLRSGIVSICLCEITFMRAYADPLIW